MHASCSLAHTFLCLLLLTAGVIEVDVVCSNLEATHNHCHDSDELTVLREHKLLLLALLLHLLGPDTQTHTHRHFSHLRHSQLLFVMPGLYVLYST